jgi:hypothetical protein
MASVVASAEVLYGTQAVSADEFGRLKQDVQGCGLYLRDPSRDAAIEVRLHGGASAAEAAAAGGDGGYGGSGGGDGDYDEDKGLSDVPLCTATQVTFTLPPAPRGLSYELRYRVMVDGEEKQPWTNPLEHQGGVWFSPQLKGAKASEQLPPPVVLDAEWERRHIQAKWRWQTQIHYPHEHEREARLFTLSGLIPSVTGSRGASWIGGGLYGQRTVEIQYRLQELGRDGSAACDGGDDGDDDDGWVTVPCASGNSRGNSRVTYHTPATDVMTMLLALSLNWLKVEGVPKLQETLVSESTRHRSANVRALRSFVLESRDALEPWWLAHVVPLLESSPLLQFVLPDRQDRWMRGLVLGAMQWLHRHSLIAEIPHRYERDAPAIKHLSVSGVEIALDNLEQWIEVREGDDFVLDVTAERSHVGLSKLKPQSVSASVGEPEQFGMRLWFLLQQQSGDSSLSSIRKLVRDGDDAGRYVPFGQKLRPKRLVCSEDDGTVSCSLPIRGTHAIHGYALLERGAELSIRIICEENWAYEDDAVTLRLRVVAPVVRSSAESSAAAAAAAVPHDEAAAGSPSLARTVTAAARLKERHIPRRLTAPRVFGDSKSEEEVRAKFGKSRRYLNVQPVDLASGRARTQYHKALVRDVLTELGHQPSEDDLEHWLRTMHADESELTEEVFVKMYAESNWSSPMLAGALTQLEAAVRSKRNAFLLETMKLPKEQWVRWPLRPNPSCTHAG